MQKRIVTILHSLSAHNVAEMVEKGSTVDVSDYAKQFDFSECEERTQTLPHLDYIDTVNGVDIYYNTGTDWYLFCKEDEEDTVRDPKPEISVEEAVEALKAHGYVAPSLWSLDDIKGKAKEMEFELTDEQVKAVAENLESVDANYGINWESIECAIEEITK